jgi:hypothetical protein
MPAYTLVGLNFTYKPRGSLFGLAAARSSRSTSTTCSIAIIWGASGPS